MLQGIRACVFDAYGTLLDVHAPTAAIAGEIGENAAAISQMWRDKQLQYTWLRSLMGDHLEFWQVTQDALDYALEAHGVDDPGIREKLLNLYWELKAYDDALPALTALTDAGLATAILSNGSPDMLNAAVGSAGLGDVLNENLSIEDVGIYKPDPRVYQLAVDRLGVKANEICFVSTNCWDAHGAAHFGFQVVWMNRFGLADDRLPGAPKAVIGGLDELPQLVGAG